VVAADASATHGVVAALAAATSSAAAVVVAHAAGVSDGAVGIGEVRVAVEEDGAVVGAGSDDATRDAWRASPPLFRMDSATATAASTSASSPTALSSPVVYPGDAPAHALLQHAASVTTFRVALCECGGGCPALVPTSLFHGLSVCPLCSWDH
jgi:hypothetical protein